MRLLSLCPRIRKQGNTILATTAWRLRLLSLGTVYREVVIDPGSRKLIVNSRYLWGIARSRVTSFQDIQAVTYGYEDMAFDSVFAFAHDSFDSFSVGLRLADDSETTLFHFIGDGTFTNDGPLPDWCYWEEYAFDMSGSQGQESRVFVDLLSDMIGVSVVPPRG